MEVPDWVPYCWCFAYFALTDYMPTVFHTVSIWLTASLAAQRYVYVCCSVQSTVRRRLCTMRGTVVVIAVVYTAAVASHVCRLGELTFSPVRVPSLLKSYNGTTAVEVTACEYQLTAFVARHETLYFNVYYWSRVLLIHVIPCAALVFLNSGLIRTMRAAHHRRCQMTSRRLTAALASRRQTVTVTETPASEYEMQPLTSLPSAPGLPTAAVIASPSPQRQLDDSLPASVGDSSARSTMMLVTVVGVFLLVEVPLSLSIH